MVDGERKISIEPSELSFQVDFQLYYKNKLINKQKNLVNFHSDNLKNIYKSRTFLLIRRHRKIKKNGLAKEGGSLENAIVVDKDKILNNGGLRNAKEFVNHKILDLLVILSCVLQSFRKSKMSSRWS